MKVRVRPKKLNYYQGLNLSRIIGDLTSSRGYG